MECECDLNTLSVTDQFNSSDTQSCSYAYDDMVRLTASELRKRDGANIQL